MNAVRHGLLARCIVLENESRAGFDSLLESFVERFGPVDGVELGMVEEMLSAFWRQRRAWAIETHILDTAISAAPAADEELTRLTRAFTSTAQLNLELVQRYETRLHRIFQRALHNLLLMRSPALDADRRELPNESTMTAVVVTPGYENGRAVESGCLPEAPPD